MAGHKVKTQETVELFQLFSGLDVAWFYGILAEVKLT
jgi:hypothetical protein